jgi:hypothetical protein
METSLHHALKRHYAGDEAQTEVRWGNFRVDAVVGDLLIEVQHGSLSAIQRKVQQLTAAHRVLVVKPIVVRKLLVQQARPEGPVTSRRLSPKRGTLVDLFEELVYFTRAFPHPNLTLEAVLVDIEEWRYPGHGRRRRWRQKDFVVSDQRLLAVGHSVRLEQADDLAKLLAVPLRREFHTGQLAQDLDVPRSVAQRIAYCLREMGAVRQVGKRGNTICYAPVSSRRNRRAA